MEPIGPQTASSSRILKPLPRNRRQTVRHRVHTPAYASLNGGSDDMVLDLSEVIDISERGAAIQTSSSWSPSHVLNLCLDLSETNSYLQTTGYVVWANRSGRIGVCFPNLSEGSRRKLQEWLFMNALVGAANYVARHNDFEFKADGKSMAKPQRSSGASSDLRAADYTTTLTALAAVQREIEGFGSNLNSALQLIADRCRTFTRATGSAIALSDNYEMVCRASSGDAPPVGATLDITSGFSGYCARTGYLQRCDDTETDTRVDRESCRLLGIRSMVAVPIRLGETVIGLLEVFSSTAHAFNERDGTILQRLADTVLAAMNRAKRPRSVPEPAPRPQPKSSPLGLTTPGPSFGTTSAPTFRTISDDPETLSGIRLPRRHLALLVITASSIVLVLAYLLAPWVIEKVRPAPQAVQPYVQAQNATTGSIRVTAPIRPPSLEEVRKRAELGDPYEQVALATRYAIGEDVPQDYGLALRWFLKAAEQGHVGAQDTLGAYYWLGHGAPKDVTKAYFWSVLARAGGKDASKVRVAFMTSQLTRAQALAIQREANDFLRQHPPLMNSDNSY